MFALAYDERTLEYIEFHRWIEERSNAFVLAKAQAARQGRPFDESLEGMQGTCAETISRCQALGDPPLLDLCLHLVACRVTGGDILAGVAPDQVQLCLSWMGDHLRVREPYRSPRPGLIEQYIGEQSQSLAQVEQGLAALAAWRQQLREERKGGKNWPMTLDAWMRGVPLLLHQDALVRGYVWRETLELLWDSGVPTKRRQAFAARWAKKLLSLICLADDRTLHGRPHNPISSALASLLHSQMVECCRTLGQMLEGMSARESKHIVLLSPTTASPFGAHHVLLAQHALKHTAEALQRRSMSNVKLEFIFSIDNYSLPKAARLPEEPDLSHRRNIAALQVVAEPDIHIGHFCPPIWFEPQNDCFAEMLRWSFPAETEVYIVLGEDALCYYAERDLDRAHPLLGMNHVIVGRECDSVLKAAASSVMQALRGDLIRLPAVSSGSSSQIRRDLRTSGDSSGLGALAKGYAKAYGLYRPS